MRQESSENNLRQWSAIHNSLLKMLSGKIGLGLAKTRCMLFLFLFILVLQNQSSIDLWLLLYHRKKIKDAGIFLSIYQTIINLSGLSENSFTCFTPSHNLKARFHYPYAIPQFFIILFFFLLFLFYYPFLLS